MGQRTEPREEPEDRAARLVLGLPHTGRDAADCSVSLNLGFLTCKADRVPGLYVMHLG